MYFQKQSEEGEWFYFFGSSVDQKTGDVVYEEPVGHARARIRSMIPFLEEQLSKRKKAVEHVYNPKTRAMDRVTYYPDQTPEEIRKERDDAYDYAITGLEGFKNKDTGEILDCDRKNKLDLMGNEVFNRYFARCQQLLSAAGITAEEVREKN